MQQQLLKKLKVRLFCTLQTYCMYVDPDRGQLRVLPGRPVASKLLRVRRPDLQEAIFGRELLRALGAAILRGALPRAEGVAVRRMRKGNHRKVSSKFEGQFEIWVNKYIKTPKKISQKEAIP